MAIRGVDAYKSVFNDIDRQNKSGLKGPIKYSKHFNEVRNDIEKYRTKSGAIDMRKIRSKKAKDDFNRLIREYKNAYANPKTGRLSAESRKSSMEQEILNKKLQTYSTPEVGKNKPLSTEDYAATIDNMQMIQKLAGGVEEMALFFDDDVKAIFYKVADMTEAGQISNKDTLETLFNKMKEKMDNVPESVKASIKKDDRYQMVEEALDVLSKNKLDDATIGDIFEGVLKGIASGGGSSFQSIAQQLVKNLVV